MNDLSDMINALNRLGKLPEEAAKEAAAPVLAVAKEFASDGVTPDGNAWEPRKSDGGRALVNAAEALSVKVLGAIVQIILKGPEAIHNFGTKRIPKRQIIPDGQIPVKMAKAVKNAAIIAFDRLVNGG